MPNPLTEVATDAAIDYSDHGVLPFTPSRKLWLVLRWNADAGLVNYWRKFHRANKGMAI